MQIWIMGILHIYSIVLLETQFSFRAHMLLPECKIRKNSTITYQVLKNISNKHIQLFCICAMFREEMTFVVLCAKNNNKSVLCTNSFQNF
jgi:hypothetical protein